MSDLDTHAAPARNGDASKEERAYRYLDDAIQTGQIKAGSRVIIAEVARQLAVSEIPVRAALQRLAGEGHVVFKPNSGFRVSLPDPARVYEAVVVLGALWELAGLLAAENRTDENIATLRSIHQRAEQAIATHDVIEFSRCGREFHDVLAAAAGNSYLMQLTARIIQDAERGTAQLSQTPDRLREAHLDHEFILQAVVARQPQKAAQLLRWHVEDINQTLGRMTRSPSEDI